MAGPDDRTRPTFVVEDDAPKRRGRPPGSGAKPKAPPRASTGARAEAEDVRRAMKTLESAYAAIGAGLIISGAPDTAAVWAEKAEGLKESNGAALEASPRLAKMIASTGSSGGALTLISTHVIAIAPIVVMAQSERALKAAQAAGVDPETPQRESFADKLRRSRHAAQEAGPDASAQSTQPQQAPQLRRVVNDDPTWIPGL